MKASTIYRLIADLAEKQGTEDFTANLAGTFVAHLAVDRGMSRERILEVVGLFYDAMQPGFSSIKQAASELKPEDMGNLDKLASVSDAGIVAMLAANRKGPSS